MNGKVVSEVLEGMRTFDLLVAWKRVFREDINALGRLPIQLPEGGTVPLGNVARIYESGGPNTVNREHVRRRVVIQCNVEGRGVVMSFKISNAGSNPSSRTCHQGIIQLLKGSFRVSNRPAA